MDPPDKERTQAPNVNSNVTPPSKRRQMSSDAAGTEQMSAAASAHPTAMAAAAAALFAAPAMGCSTTSAGRPRCAVFAARRLSPAARCDQDSLSVALSFLDAADFAAASRVCCHWQRTAELQSAWTDFSVERLISGLIEDEYEWTQSRSVRVHAKHLRADAWLRAEQSANWRRLAELYLYGYTGQERTWVSLSQIAQLPQLESLRLGSIRLTDVATAFSAMAPRLLALKCEVLEDAAAVQPHLHLLAHLRVLDMDGAIDAQELLPLHHLEYLQLRRVGSVNRDLLLVIRRLSVEHRMRHLSLASRYRNVLVDLDSLAAELSGADSGLAPASLLSIRVFGILSSVSRSALLALPNLTRLDWSCRAPARKSATRQQPLSPPSPLQQLHVDLPFDECGAAGLLQLAAARMPQLCELHMGDLPPSFDQLIRPLRSLRLLDINLSESSPLLQELLQSLATLPLFTELIVRQSRFLQRPFQLTAETLRCIAESRSWRLIRLIGRYDQPLLTPPNDVDAQLAERLTDFRVQGEWWHNTVVYRLMISADGTAAWVQTAV